MEVADKKKQREVVVRNWIIILSIPALIITSWLLGNYFIVDGNVALISNSIHSKEFVSTKENAHKWTLTDSLRTPAGFAYIGKGNGYGGPMLTLTYTSTSKVITSIEIISHSETHTYFKKLQEKNYYEKIIGNKPESLAGQIQIDAISGATISSQGIVESIIDGYSKGEEISLNGKAPIIFGIKEGLVIFLFALSLFIVKVKNPTRKKWLFWSAQIASIAILGVWLNSAITLTQINALTQGYIPGFAGGFFINILLLASLLIPITTGKNTYCTSVCPFGAAQRLIGFLGTPKTFRPSYYHWLKRIQWTAALSAVIVASFFRDPTISDYTIFGNLFRLNGSFIAVGVVVVVIVLSLFIKRPWCHFMCPVDGAFQYLKSVRRIGKEFIKR